ncbi:hypothetical protein CFRS1_v006629 [Colletotrichum fructicola]|nr:hypothetical protein CFRS1_v006629 [Colletotrichum fructicola]
MPNILRHLVGFHSCPSGRDSPVRFPPSIPSIAPFTLSMEAERERNRIRDNQRRSRARKKELQPKFSKLHAESQRRTRNFDSFSVKSAWAIIKSTST